MLDFLEKIVTNSDRQYTLITDALKQEIVNITLFYGRVKSSFLSEINDVVSETVPLSSYYNNFLEACENDARLLRHALEQVRNNILSSWNISEPEILITNVIYDEKFQTEFDQAVIVNDTIVLPSTASNSVKSNLKYAPEINSYTSNSKILPFYGKAFGCYIEENANGEDGIRYTGNDGNIIIDGLDTHVEVEAVVLDESRADTIYFSEVSDDPLTLTTTIKLIFDKPIAINRFQIKPYNRASNTYYRIVDVRISDGEKTYPVKFKETAVVTDTDIVIDPTLFFVDGKIKTVYVVLRQYTGYYIKYMLASLVVGNKTLYFDISNPSEVEKAYKFKNTGNAIINMIKTANSWVMSYWMPAVTSKILPVLDITKGDGGYVFIPTIESKRKRYSIGITDIDLQYHTYADVAEKVSNSIDIPESTTGISVDADFEGDVSFYLSFDDGLSWNQVIPLSRKTVVESEYKIPQTLFINSFLSLTRKNNTLTGDKAFIDTDSLSLRVRFVLKKDSNMNKTPKIYDWSLKYNYDEFYKDI